MKLNRNSNRKCIKVVNKTTNEDYLYTNKYFNMLVTARAIASDLHARAITVVNIPHNKTPITGENHPE